MTILEALHSGHIRYANDRVFDADTRQGECLHGETLADIPALVAAQARPYVGSVFVQFDEPLPPDVPTDTPAHTWAWCLCLGPLAGPLRPSGAIIVWSTEAHEQTRRQDTSLPFTDFTLRRTSGADEA